MELYKRMGSKVHQRRHTEVQREPDHSEVGCGNGKEIEAAIQAAYEEGESKLKGSSKSVPSLKVLKTPLRDGDLERPDDVAYADSYFINANSASAPGIVDADRQPILERSEVSMKKYRISRFP